MNRSVAASSSTATLTPSRVTLLGLIVLGYIANLMTGYGTHMGAWRPVPLYLFFAAGLLVFQHVVSTKRSFLNGVYITLTSGFALVYAADLVLNTSVHGHFTRDPQTYLLINGFLFLAYWGATIRDWWNHLSRQWLSTIGADLLGFALINLTSAGLLYATQVTMGVTVDLAQLWHLSPAGHYHLLYEVELFVAGISAVIAFLLIGIAVVLSKGGSDPVPEIMHAISNMVSRACRTALAPLVWIGTGVLLSVLSQHITQFYAEAAGTRNWYQLFNPMSQFRQARLDQEVMYLGLGAAAVLSTLVSVLLADQDRTMFRRAWEIIKQEAQVILLCTLFFVLSLTGLNALVVAMGVTALEPFQFGLWTSLSALALAVYQFVQAIQKRNSASASTATSGATATSSSQTSTGTSTTQPSSGASATQTSSGTGSTASTPSGTGSSTSQTATPATGASSTPTNTGSGTVQASTGSGTTQSGTGSSATQSGSGSGATQASTGSGSTQTNAGSDITQTSTGSGTTQTSTGSGSTQRSAGADTTQTNTGSGTTQTGTGSDTTQKNTGGSGTTQTSSGSSTTQTSSGSSSTQTSTGASTTTSTTSSTGGGETRTTTSSQAGGKYWIVWEDENGTLHSTQVAVAQATTTTSVSGTSQGQTSQQSSAAQPVLVMVSASGNSTQ